MIEVGQHDRCYQFTGLQNEMSGYRQTCFFNHAQTVMNEPTRLHDSNIFKGNQESTSHIDYLKYRLGYFTKPVTEDGSKMIKKKKCVTGQIHLAPSVYCMLHLIFSPTDFCEKPEYFHLLPKIFPVLNFGESGIRISTDTPDTLAILWMD